VRAGIVEKKEEYFFSSCGDYYGTKKRHFGVSNARGLKSLVI
jgi:hypothetical protein